MKILSITTIAMIVITLFASCQNGKDVKQILSKSATREEIMYTIANNVNMTKEMTAAILSSNNDHATILENKEMVLKMRRDYIIMMQGKHINLIEKYKSDDGMASNTNTTMMVN